MLNNAFSYLYIYSICSEQLFDAGCVTSLVKLLSQISFRVSILSSYQVEAENAQNLFIEFVKLLKSSLW